MKKEIEEWLKKDSISVIKETLKENYFEK